MSKLIELTQGKFAIVDDEDYDFLMQWKWHVSEGYAKRTGKKKDGKLRFKNIFMHRVINKTPDNKLTDHINFNRLDNRRKNLRECDYLENIRNSKKRNVSASSKFKGVHWNNYHSKWGSSIRKDKGITEFLGYHENEIDAAIAYDSAASAYHGEFACLNFLGVVNV